MLVWEASEVEIITWIMVLEENHKVDATGAETWEL